MSCLSFLLIQLISFILLAVRNPASYAEKLLLLYFTHIIGTHYENESCGVLGYVMFYLVGEPLYLIQLIKQ